MNLIASFSRFVLTNFYLLRKRDMFLLCWWNAAKSAFEFGRLFDKKVSIITLKIVKYNRKNHWLATLKITGAMRCSAIRTSKVTVITNRKPPLYCLSLDGRYGKFWLIQIFLVLVWWVWVDEVIVVSLMCYSYVLFLQVWKQILLQYLHHPTVLYELLDWIK